MLFARFVSRRFWSRKRCCRASTDVAPCLSLPALEEGMTSEFERRVWSRQRPYDYAVQSDLQNQQIIQLTIGIGGSSAAQLRVTIHSALQPLRI